MNFMRGSKEKWEKLNPILEDGQPGLERPNEDSESTEFKLKIGDGVTPWNSLPYIGGNTDPEIIIKVINSLDSDSTTDALSAYMGKELNNKIEDIERNLIGVINSLDSDSTTDALSAAMGKELNNKIGDVERILSTLFTITEESEG